MAANTVIFILVLNSLVTRIASSDSDCETSQKLFSKLCIEPSPNSTFNIQKFNALEPADGYKIFSGNDICRSHMGHLLKATPITSTDDLDKICYKIHGGVKDPERPGGAIGHFTGFGNLHVITWRCKPTLDIPTMKYCDFTNKLDPNYAYRFPFYFTDTEKEDVFVAIHCYPDGQVGWHSFELSNKLEPSDEVAILKQVENLGFSTTNVVKMFDDSKCA